VSGALAERVFATKMERVGFTNVWIGERIDFSVEDAVNYPLFTDEVVHLMRTLIPPEKQPSVAMSVIIKATKPQRS